MDSLGACGFQSSVKAPLGIFGCRICRAPSGWMGVPYRLNLCLDGFWGGASAGFRGLGVERLRIPSGFVILMQFRFQGLGSSPPWLFRQWT